MKRLTTWSMCVSLSVACLAAGADTSFKSPANFTAEGRALKAQNAIAMLTDEFFSGQVQAIKILYTPADITEAAKQDILVHHANTFSTYAENAVLVLFLDKDQHLYQVNLTVVLKGRTTGGTIAGDRQELAKFASFSFDGQRVKLTSKGTYQSSDPQFPMVFTWDVHDDLPVFDIRKHK